MASKAAFRRLTKEYLNIQRDPVEYCDAHPSEHNILEWHYVITGPPSTPYEGGQYHGTLMFPPEYPFKPPAIRMITPSGRFQPGTRLCLSFSDFHPQSWNPSWMVSTILTGLLSFMTSEELSTGSMNMPVWERRRLAEASREWNTLHNPRFAEQFPDLMQENKEYLDKRATAAADRAAASPARTAAAKTENGTAQRRQRTLKYWAVGLFITACIIARIFGVE